MEDKNCQKFMSKGGLILEYQPTTSKPTRPSTNTVLLTSVVPQLQPSAIGPSSAKQQAPPQFDKDLSQMTPPGMDLTTFDRAGGGAQFSRKSSCAISHSSVQNRAST